MIYAIYCQLSPGPEIELLEKAIQDSAQSRKMTNNLWLIDADSMPNQIETILQSFKVKSFVAPLHPNGPSGGNLLPTDKGNSKTLCLIHCQLLIDAEKETLEKLMQEFGPSLALTDTLWLIKANSIPKKVENFLQSLKVLSFAAPLHPNAPCGGSLLASDREWILLQTS